MSTLSGIKKKKTKWSQVRSDEVLPPNELGKNLCCRRCLDFRDADKGCGAVIGAISFNSHRYPVLNIRI